MAWTFKDSISKHLHHHTLSNILFYGISNVHWTRNISCSHQKLRAWLTFQPIVLMFGLIINNFFPIAFQIQLQLANPLVTCLLCCVCIHPIDLFSIHLLWCAPMTMNAHIHMMLSMMSLHPLQRKLVFMWLKTTTCFSFHISNIKMPCWHCPFHVQGLNARKQCSVLFNPCKSFVLTIFSTRFHNIKDQTKEQSCWNHHLSYQFFLMKEVFNCGHKTSWIFFTSSCE